MHHTSEYKTHAFKNLIYDISMLQSYKASEQSLSVTEESKSPEDSSERHNLAQHIITAGSHGHPNTLNLMNHVGRGKENQKEKVVAS